MTTTRLPDPAPSMRPSEPARGGIGWYRWVICGLLFFATTISYVDRQIISLFKKDVLFGQFGWDDNSYANVIAAFQFAYALGYLLSGRLFDRIGVRIGFFLAVAIWSVAAMAHGLVGYISPQATLTVPLPAIFSGPAVILMTVLGFGAARAVLGFAEGGTFPAAIKAVSEWFPKRERALATGIFNSGSNVGALITPWLVWWLTERWGWPAAFYATGAMGFFWLLIWFPFYNRPERHPRVSPAELAYIRSDPADPPAHIPWRRLLRYRQTWAFAIGMAITSPIWWFYLYWSPGFLQDVHHLKFEDLAMPLMVIYLMTSVGSIGGGWLSSRLIKNGWTINSARKTALLVCALCVVPVYFASTVSSLWLATILIGIAASAHQGFSANLYTIVSDTVPRKAVSSVTGIGGMAGALCGMAFAKITGLILATGWPIRYAILFGIASGGYLVALAIIHLMLPRLEPMEFEEA